ncbi:hypothetical protein [Martelella mediterranea]|nr:hypothetical protein [Martelella mediterranea]
MKQNEKKQDLAGVIHRGEFVIGEKARRGLQAMADATGKGNS